MAKKKKGNRVSTILRVDLDQAEPSASIDDDKIDSGQDYGVMRTDIDGENMRGSLDYEETNVNLDCDAMGTNFDNENMDGDLDSDETDLNHDKMSVHSNYDKMSATLDSTAMQQLQAEQRVLLDSINELRSFGLGQNIDPPRVIVVGDRSAGKSSVLEAISRVRFPIKDGLCTRFATELMLRQKPHPTIAVRVQSYDGLDTFNRSGFKDSDLPRIVEEAKRQMGITNDSSAFSEDVLRIEISGPDVPQLTLVDLPGIFHDEAKAQGLDGEEVVSRLAEKYMSQENSIILAVISAQQDLASQKVLDEAKWHDPDRVRTLGIITKPDKIEDGTYVELAQNHKPSHKLKLGWHVLRNRRQEEADWTDAERDVEENEFFSLSYHWRTVSSQNRGIETLREKLSQFILTHIQRKLPGLIVNVEEQIKTCQKRLEELGTKRSSTNDIKKYLVNISNHYQRVAREAIHGNYADNFFGGLYPNPQISYEDRRVKKLRALVRDLNRAFYFVLITKGGRRQIQWDDEKPPVVPHHLEPLIALYTLDEQIEISIGDLTKELERLALENQGVEFPGSSNDKVALALFRDQSACWEAIANQHVRLVTHFVRRFVEDLVGHVAGPDKRTADAVIKDLVAPYFEEKQAVLEAKVLELLRHYKTGSDPQPMYNIFLDGVEQRRDDRCADIVRQGIQRNPELFSDKAKALGGRHLVSTALKIPRRSSGAAGHFDAEHTIDNAMEYYNMSLRVFTDNVVTLALENCLVSDIPNILSPEKVYDMTDDKVTALATESKQMQREREELRMQLNNLRMGLAVCRGYTPREFSVIIQKVPAFSIVEPQSTQPGRSKSEPSTGSQPSLQASGQAPSESPSAQNSEASLQKSDQAELSGNPTVATAPTSGVSKPAVSGTGLFATVPSSAPPNTGGGSGTFTRWDTLKSGNTASFSSLSSIPGNGGSLASGTQGGIFGGTTQSGIPARNVASTTTDTRPSSGGTGFFGQKTRTTAPAGSGSIFGSQGFGTGH